MQYPPLSRAPKKVRAKAALFGVHPFCAANPDEACKPCTHLVRMAFDAYYGHILSQDSLAVRINSDLREEVRKH